MTELAPELVKWPESKMLIRFSDCDMYGHLSNIQYVKYFMDAREDHIANNYGYTMASFAKQGIGWVVGSNQISYFRPAKVNEPVVIRSAVVELASSYIVVEMQMLDEHATHIKSALWSKFVNISLKDGRKAEINDELRTFFESIAVENVARDFNTRMNELKSIR